MTESLGTIRLALDLIRAQRRGYPGIDRRQRARLTALLNHARANSPFYQRLYAALPIDRTALADLPPVTKQQLMSSFEDWVCDPQITRAKVESFVTGPAQAGTPFLGRYFVCTSSGSTGHPGLFVHDRAACAFYEATTYRMDLAWLSGRQWLQILHSQIRWGVIVGTGGHFVGEGWIEYLRRRHWWRRNNWRVFSLQLPLAELVAQLNAFQPAILTGYPSALEILAAEQMAGRLRLRPVIVELGGESVDEDGRGRIAAAFGEKVLHDCYSASECLVMAFDCEHRWLHINSDWVILEPVEADYSPTPPGTPSHTVLLTNLANTVQPIIRYDLGDTVTARPDPCPCGNPLPAIRVQGRCDDVLRLQAPGGETVSVLPLAVGSVIDEAPGVQRSQLIQTGPRSLTLRLDVRPGAQPERVWERTHAALAAYLSAQGLPSIEITRAPEPPQRSATSGKFRQVIAVPPRR